MHLPSRWLTKEVIYKFRENEYLLLTRYESVDCYIYCDKTDMSGVMRKLDFCLCENKDADQLRSNCEADQRLCFRYSDSTIALLLVSGKSLNMKSVYLESEWVL